MFLRFIITMQKKFSDLCESYKTFVNTFNDFSQSFREQGVNQGQCCQVAEEILPSENETKGQQNPQQKTIKVRGSKVQNAKKKSLKVEETQEEISDGEQPEAKKVENLEIIDQNPHVQECAKISSNCKLIEHI